MQTRTDPREGELTGMPGYHSHSPDAGKKPTLLKLQTPPYKNACSRKGQEETGANTRMQAKAKPRQPKPTTRAMQASLWPLHWRLKPDSPCPEAFMIKGDFVGGGGGCVSPPPALRAQRLRGAKRSGQRGS